MTQQLWRVGLWFGAIALCLQTTRAADPATDSRNAKTSAQLGRIKGRITYKRNSKAPWRYSRYYVDRKSKSLAQTLVALRGRTLGKLAAKVKPKTHVMDQKDFRFVPESLVIRAGDDIRFTNSDPSTHNVNSKGSVHPFDLTLGFGDELVERFPRAGGAGRPVVLGCIFHGSMRAWIFVFDHPWQQLTKPDGRFVLDQIPAGSYWLDVMHPAGQLRRSRRIEISADKTTTIDIELSPDDRVK